MRRRNGRVEAFELPAALRTPPPPGGDGPAWLEARRRARLEAGMDPKAANGRWIGEAAWWIARRDAAARGEPFDQPCP